jgi:hypothetical protein
VIRKRTFWGITAGLFTIAVPVVHAEGHGPIFGLATPTLGEGQWSSDTAVMSLATEEDTAVMFREMLGYGLTPDLQFMLTFPIGPTDDLMMPPNMRTGSMMAGFGDVEAGLLWRFDRVAPDVGKRSESTLITSVLVPSGDDQRRGIEVTAGMHLAAVTGYASRSTYWWVGGGTQLRKEENGDRLGNLYYLTGVFGWRPPVFRGDYPKPDWRIFLEGVAEFAARDRNNGATIGNSGGQRVLLGPSMLGLFGTWGIEGGVLFPIAQSLNGNQVEEDYRAKLVVTYWF